MSVSRRVTAVVTAVVAGALAGAPAAPAAPAPAAPATSALYPDLVMYGPTDFQLTTEDAGGQPHQFLRFTTRVVNLGQGALEIQRVPMASGTAELKQRVYQSPAGFQDLHLTTVAFDPLDFNYPIPDIARYEVWTQRGYKRAKARGFRRGRPLFVHDNVGHCISDNEAETDATVNYQRYPECNKFVTGISVGWADVEFWTGTDQTIDFGATLPPDGDYVLRVIADPNNLLYESPGKADPAREGEIPNSAVSYFRLIQGHLAGVDFAG